MNLLLHLRGRGDLSFNPRQSRYWEYVGLVKRQRLACGLVLCSLYLSPSVWSVWLE